MLFLKPRQTQTMLQEANITKDSMQEWFNLMVEFKKCYLKTNKND